MPLVYLGLFCRYLCYTFLDAQDFESLPQYGSVTLVFHKNHEEIISVYNTPSFTKTHNKSPLKSSKKKAA